MPARAARSAQAPARAQAAMMDFGELFVAPVCTDARVGSEELASIGREDAGNHEVRCVFSERVIHDDVHDATRATRRWRGAREMRMKTDEIVRRCVRARRTHRAQGVQARKEEAKLQSSRAHV